MSTTTAQPESDPRKPRLLSSSDGVTVMEDEVHTRAADVVPSSLDEAAGTFEVVASTGLSIHQVNALEGTWSHGKGENGEQLPSAVASPLWERTQKAGHTFLVLTEAGAAWEAPKASPKAAKAKAPVMDLEEARRALAGAPVVSQVGKEVEAEA